MTRQIQQFHPANFEISADITEGENEQEAANELRRLVIRVLYKDKPIERDSLIKQLCDSITKPELKKSPTNYDEENEFPYFQP